jgi:hypothetical protein
MAFVPHLPTWINTAELYRVNAVTLATTFEALVPGQLYYPRRGPASSSLGELYFLHPLTSNVLLEEGQLPTNLFHLLRLEVPSGSGLYKGYGVRLVYGRWLGFPNEHLVARVQQLTHAYMVSLGLDT